MVNQRIMSTRRSITTAILALALVGGSLPAASQTDSIGNQGPAVNHNTWTSGTAMPTARMGAAAAAIGPNIYVVGGYNITSFLGNNEIYRPSKNKWTTGSPDPHPRGFAAYAVVNKVLYIFGGSDGSQLLDLTESYNPATNTWTTLAPMPYVQLSASAVADKNIIYVIGGQNNSGYLSSVASYNATTNTWTEEAPLMVAKGWLAVGLLGPSVVAADGSQGAPNFLGDNEGYSPKTNTWSELTADSTPRAVGCYAAIKGQLYVAGGNDGTLLTLNEAYNPKTKSWATLAPMPQGVYLAAASVQAGGRLYCFGGGHYQQNVFDYVQIYQP